MPTESTTASSGFDVSTIEDAMTQFRLGYEKTFENKPQGVLATLVDVETGNKTKFVDTVAVGPNRPMEEWVGDVPQTRDHRYYTMRTPIKKYVKELSIPRFDVVYGGGLNALKRRIDGFFKESVADQERLAHNKLFTSAYPTCIDNTPIFGASHPHVTTSAGAVTTYSNYTTDPLSRSAYESARQSAALINNERGVLNPHRFKAILVGAKNVKKAKRIFEAEQQVMGIASETNDEADSTHWAIAAAAITNVWQGEIAVIEYPYFQSYEWLLIDPDNKPLRQVVNRSPEMFEPDMRDIERMDFDRLRWRVEGDWGYEAQNHFSVFFGNASA